MSSFFDNPEPLPKKILIVDDQTFNIEALKIILKYKLRIDTAFCCDYAYDGLEALKKVINDADLSKKTSSYCLILMDCNMPHLDGYETSDRIRQFLFDNEIE